MSVYSMMFIGMSPLGSMAAGFEASHFGAPFTIAAGAGVCFLAAAGFFTQMNTFRAGARELLGTTRSAS